MIVFGNNIEVKARTAALGTLSKVPNPLLGALRARISLLLNDGGVTGKFVHADGVWDTVINLRRIGAAISVISKGNIGERAAGSGINLVFDGTIMDSAEPARFR